LPTGFAIDRITGDLPFYARYEINNDKRLATVYGDVL
jgi:hypothetical protein